MPAREVLGAAHWRRCGTNDYPAFRTLAVAFGHYLRPSMQREMDNATLARVHGAEWERRSGFLGPVSRYLGHQLQFLHAHAPPILAIERNLRKKAFLPPHCTQHDIFEGVQELSMGFEQQI